MVSFLAGKPNADTFPFSAIRVDLKPVVRQNLQLATHGALRPKLTLAFTQVPGDPVETLTIEADALSEGLQYGATAGLPSLNKWLENLQETRHKRPKDGSWRLSLGSGSQDLINKVRFASLVRHSRNYIRSADCSFFPSLLRRSARLSTRTTASSWSRRCTRACTDL